jgi:hypothetical protein
LISAVTVRNRQVRHSVRWCTSPSSSTLAARQRCVDCIAYGLVPVAPEVWKTGAIAWYQFQAIFA